MLRLHFFTFYSKVWKLWLFLTLRIFEDSKISKIDFTVYLQNSDRKILQFPHCVCEYFKHECQMIGSKQISSWSSTSFLAFLDSIRFVAFNDPKTERQVKKWLQKMYRNLRQCSSTTQFACLKKSKKSDTPWIRFQLFCLPLLKATKTKQRPAAYLLRFYFSYLDIY